MIMIIIIIVVVPIIIIVINLIIIIIIIMIIIIILLLLLLWSSSSSYQCDINCAGHFTLDALASRPVACIVLWLVFIMLWSNMDQSMMKTNHKTRSDPINSCYWTLVSEWPSHISIKDYLPDIFNYNKFLLKILNHVKLSNLALGHMQSKIVFKIGEEISRSSPYFMSLFIKKYFPCITLLNFWSFCTPNH